ncbi:unnamed protein product [Staurois parvus]|uniref:Uncharacterized protein n=1 Tax=Staurois parvus TaxID=386267 RepID=A0ABN9GPI4_9NEOB|nr:unnamed protein product [Staurois parvus]
MTRSASLVSLALTPLEVEQRVSRDQGDKIASRCLQLLQLETFPNSSRLMNLRFRNSSDMQSWYGRSPGVHQSKAGI